MLRGDGGGLKVFGDFSAVFRCDCVRNLTVLVAGCTFRDCGSKVRSQASWRPFSDKKQQLPPCCGLFWICFGG